MKIKPLRLNHHQFAEFYANLCDVVYRDDAHLEPYDDFMHTSLHARKVALEIADRLAMAGYLEYR